MRKRYVQINGELVDKDELTRGPSGPFVFGDIQPYKSMLDGSIVTSRSQHREMMKRHGVIEVGNEDLSKHIRPPEYKKGDLRERLIHEMRKYR